MANLCKLKPVGYSDGSDPFNIYNFLKKSQLVPNTTVQPSNLPEPLDTVIHVKLDHLETCRVSLVDEAVSMSLLRLTQCVDMRSEDNLRPAQKK